MSKKQESHLSASEIYANHFESSEARYYTQVPNIIDHLTYSCQKKGQKPIKKRLSVYAKELYRIIRMIASDHGKCWNTREDLALKMNCSEGTITNAMQELLSPMDQLDGNPLIKEQRRSKQVERDDGTKYAIVICTRTVINIWSWNNAFMATVKYQNQYGSLEEVINRGASCGDEAGGGASCGDEAYLGTPSCGDANNNLSKNIPLFKEQQPTESDDSAIGCLSKIQKQIVRLSPDQRKIFEYLIKGGFEEKTALNTCKKYSLQEIDKATEYYINQKQKNAKKGKYIEKAAAYFMGILKGRYWENV